MTNLEKFKKVTENRYIKKFEIIFSPEFFNITKCNILENNEDSLRKLINNIYGKDYYGNDFFTHVEKQLEILEIKNLEILKFIKVTNSYSYGHIFDGIDNYTFDIIGIE
jgi:hypothetical protein